jgi:hypothetical protein
MLGDDRSVRRRFFCGRGGVAQPAFLVPSAPCGSEPSRRPAHVDALHSVVPFRSAPFRRGAMNATKELDALRRERHRM